MVRREEVAQVLVVEAVTRVFGLPMDPRMVARV
jgi:hypothetical protein